MITIAVTGGIGSGKSTAAAALRDRGALVVDSDQLAREVVAPGTPGLAAIAAAFGSAMISDDGGLDRAALARVVFADPVARAQLEAITHPLVRSRFAALRGQAPPDAVVVNDVPLLSTLSAAASFHLVLGVQADAELRVRRLIGRGLAEPDARARMAAQLTDEQRAALCDVVLVNHGDREELAAAMDQVWGTRLLPFEGNVRAARRAPRGGPQVTAPQPSWAAAGVRLAARVSAAAGGARVDHIGSTAVPGMSASDVLDLQLTVLDAAHADRLADSLAAAGFPLVAGARSDAPHPVGADQERWPERLHGNADPGRSINLYLKVRDAPGWRWALLFRDWLRADPAVAAEYLQLKRRLAELCRRDETSARYAQSKEPWLAQAYPRGLAWAARTGWEPAEKGTVGPPA